MSPRPLFFLTVILTLLFYQSLSNCPIGYHTLADGSCEHQIPITVDVRPTPQNFVYTITFEGGAVPFTSIDDLKSTMTISLASTAVVITPTSQTYLALQLTDDLTIIQVFLEVNEIPYATTLTVSFYDFNVDTTRSSYIKAPVSIPVAPALLLSESDTQMINVFNNMDYVLEIAWITVTTLNPYWILYMDCKLYRETLNLFKRVNVQYDSTLMSFYRATSKKIAGLKVPNVLGMYLLGNDYSLEWNKNPIVRVGFGTIDTDRIVDLQVRVDVKVHEFDSFPLFLDNFGIQIIILVVIFVLGCICSLLVKMWNLDMTDNCLCRFIIRMRKFSWNFALMTLVGSSQSLIYYFAVQIQAYFSTKTYHNQLSLAAALATFLLGCGGTIIYFIWHSNSRTDEYYRETIMNETKRTVSSLKKPLEFFGTPMDFYKAEKRIQIVAILYPLPRALIFTATMILLDSHPVAQAAVLFVIALLSVVGIIVFRPFVRRSYTIFKLIYEFLMTFTLLLVLITAFLDNNNTYDESQREALGLMLMGLWVGIPIVTLFLCLYGYINYYKQVKAEKQAIMRVAPVLARKSKLSIVAVDGSGTPTAMKDESKVGTPSHNQVERVKTGDFTYNMLPNSVDNSRRGSAMTPGITPRKETPQLSKSNFTEADNYLNGDKSQVSFVLPTKTKRGDISEILDQHNNDDVTFISNNNKAQYQAPSPVFKLGSSLKQYGKYQGPNQNQKKVAPHQAMTNESYDSECGSPANVSTGIDRKNSLMMSKMTSTGTNRSLFAYK